MKRKTLLCGTLWRNRKHLLEAVVSAKPKSGQHVACRNGRTVVVKWKNKKDVMMLSTVHTGKMMYSSKANRCGELVKKLDCVINYNQHVWSGPHGSAHGLLHSSAQDYQVVQEGRSPIFGHSCHECVPSHQIRFRKQLIRALAAADDRPGELQPKCYRNATDWLRGKNHLFVHPKLCQVC